MTTTTFRACKTALALAASAALLGACGGGGGSDSGGVEVPTATRSVAASAGSDANVDNLAFLGGWLARAVMSVSGDGAFDITAERDRPQGRTANMYGGEGLLHARVASAALRLGQPAFAAREQSSAVESETMTCLNGGSVTFTIDDADNNRKLSRGDGITLSASNCVLDPGLPAANGTMQLALNEVDLDSDEFPTALDASATFANFSVGAYGTYNGEMRLWTKPEGALERARVSYRNTTVSFAGGSVVFDFDIYGLGDDAGGSFDLNGGIGINGQTYSIVASGVMTSVGTEPPSAGELRLRDAAQDAVRLTARSSSSFDLDFLPSGATAPTAVLPGQLWSNTLGLP